MSKAMSKYGLEIDALILSNNFGKIQRHSQDMFN